MDRTAALAALRGVRQGYDESLPLDADHYARSIWKTKMHSDLVIAKETSWMIGLCSQHTVSAAPDRYTKNITIRHTTQPSFPTLQLRNAQNVRQLVPKTRKDNKESNHPRAVKGKARRNKHNQHQKDVPALATIGLF